MKLFTYFRSSASWRVRIALSWKGIPHGTVPVHLVRDGGQQHSESYREIESAGAGAGARRRRPRVRPVARDHRVPGRDASRSAAAAARLFRPRDREVDGTRHRLRHPPAAEPARAQLPARTARPGGRGRRGMGAALDRAGVPRARGAGPPARRRHTLSIWRRASRWRTCAWCRRCTTRGATIAT